MLKNQDAFQILWSIAFETIKSQARETKKYDFVTFFLIFNFLNFKKFRNIVYYQLKQMFLNHDQFFQSYATFWIKLWYTIFWDMLLQCRHTIDVAWNVPIAA